MIQSHFYKVFNKDRQVDLNILESIQQRTADYYIGEILSSEEIKSNETKQQ